MGRRRYGSSLSARYEDEYEDARASLSGGPASQLCDFPDSEHAPPRRTTTIPFGFVVSDWSATPEVDPQLYEGDQA